MVSRLVVEDDRAVRLLSRAAAKLAPRRKQRQRNERLSRNVFNHVG